MVIINGTTGISAVQSGVVVSSSIADGTIQPQDLNGNQTGTAPIYGCRAWVNFDGTRNVTDTGASTNGQPVKIRASGNVSSVVKNGIGDYTVNFTTAMSDANYSTFAQAGNAAAIPTYGSESTLGKTYSALSYRFVLNRADVTAVDREYVSVSVFR